MAAGNSNRRQIWQWLIGLGLLGLLLWLVLPRLLPGTPLTERPPAFADTQVVADTPLSHASLVVDLPLVELEQRLTREVDASLARNNEDKDFKAWRNGPLSLQMRGAHLNMTLPLGFKNRAGPDTRGSLVVTTRMTADIADDWQPQVRVNSDFDWVRKPKIRVLGVKVRVSGVVGRAIRKKLGELDATLKEKIESALVLRPRAEDWWRSLHEPGPLAEDPPAWLTVEPRALYFAPLHEQKGSLSFGIGVRARLATSVAAMPAPKSATPLPPLERATENDRGFALYLPVLADYEGLAAELRKDLAGRRIPLEQGAITPRDFTLYTSGRNLVVGVEFQGDAPGFLLDTRGTVYFTGEPLFDPHHQVLRIVNFRFTRRLSNPLLSASTWVLQDSLRQQMQSRLAWDLTDRLAEGAVQLSEQLNRPLGEDLQLEGQVEQLRMTDIACRAEGIHIGLEVRGRLKLTLAKPRPAPEPQ